MLLQRGRVIGTALRDEFRGLRRGDESSGWLLQGVATLVVKEVLSCGGPDMLMDLRARDGSGRRRLVDTMDGLRLIDERRRRLVSFVPEFPYMIL